MIRCIRELLNGSFLWSNVMRNPTASAVLAEKREGSKMVYGLSLRIACARVLRIQSFNLFTLKLRLLACAHGAVLVQNMHSVLKDLSLSIRLFEGGTYETDQTITLHYTIVQEGAPSHAHLVATPENTQHCYNNSSCTCSCMLPNVVSCRLQVAALRLIVCVQPA